MILHVQLNGIIHCNGGGGDGNGGGSDRGSVSGSVSGSFASLSPSVPRATAASILAANSPCRCFYIRSLSRRKCCSSRSNS